MSDTPEVTEQKQSEDGQPKTLGEAVLFIAGGQAIAVDGSLANHCAQVLAQMYGKEQGDLSNLGMESQQIDLSVSVGKWEALKRDGILDIFTTRQELLGYLYATRQGDVTMADVIRFADALQGMPVEQQQQAVLYIEPQNENNFFADQLNATAKSYGVKIATSLDDLSALYMPRAVS